MVRLNPIKKVLTNDKGATSVFVIFMMIVLVALGSFAITSSNVNYKLSVRAANWNVTFYDLDSEGEVYLSKLDEKLAKAEIAAYNYIIERRYSLIKSDDIPSSVQAEIHNLYKKASSGIMSENNFSDILNKVYFYYADIYLDELTAQYSDMNVNTLKTSELIDSITTNMSISTIREDTGYGLKIHISIEPPEYKFIESSGTLTAARKNSNLRYAVTEWSEYQFNNDIDNPSMEIWDGKI